LKEVLDRSHNAGVDKMIIKGKYLLWIILKLL
jgi:hypothetical protein